jgi:protocatechuate 3,4-dioxygenase beta subunit
MSRDRASVYSEEGMYDNHYRDGRTAGRGWLRSGADGEYEFWSMRPSFTPSLATGRWASCPPPPAAA